MTIGHISVGCPKKLVDSEVMLGLTQRAGHQLTADAGEAEVIIVNTFIVGFPGETGGDFEQLQSFVRAVPVRPGDIKRRRQAALMKTQRQIVRTAQKGRLGSRARIVIGGPAAEHELVLRGRLESQAPDIDPLVTSPNATRGRGHRDSSSRSRSPEAATTTSSPVRRRAARRLSRRRAAGGRCR